MLFNRVHVLRVKPKEELVAGITGYCSKHGITSGVVLGIIGSVESARLNYLKKLPGLYDTETYSGPLEIVAAQGSVALKDSELIVHIHAQLGSQSGCFGGHLVDATVFSTAEVVLGELDQQVERVADSYTGLNELRA